MDYRIMYHNRELRKQATYRAEQMKYWPSPLEERMKRLLEDNWISYKEQEIFYIYADDGWIIRYYIADFFIPEANLIIEVDGKFHDNQQQKDKMRTKDIQEHYPDVKVVRWRWEDFKDEGKIGELMRMLL